MEKSHKNMDYLLHPLCTLVHTWARPKNDRLNTSTREQDSVHKDVFCPYCPLQKHPLLCQITILHIYHQYLWQDYTSLWQTEHYLHQTLFPLTSTLPLTVTLLWHGWITSSTISTCSLCMQPAHHCFSTSSLPLTLGLHTSFPCPYAPPDPNAEAIHLSAWSPLTLFKVFVHSLTPLFTVNVHSFLTFTVCPIIS